MPSDIAARIEAWRAQLLDTSKRNRLINFKAGRTGGLALVHPDPGDLWHRLVATNAPSLSPGSSDYLTFQVRTGKGEP
jgi:hypothetical protein